MTSIRALLLASVLLVAAACGAGTGNYELPKQSEVAHSTNNAVGLVSTAPPAGYAPKAVASGHDRADDEGHEVSQTVKGRALFQIACSGLGRVTVTIPAQKLSKLVRCGAKPVGFPFRQQLTALVVGQRDSSGAYAWRILSKA